MIYPDFLKNSSTIAFIAPSFGCNVEPYLSSFNNAVDAFEKLGHTTLKGPNCYKGEGLGISNTKELCGREINEYFIEKDSDAVISCGGGEMMCETLPFVDFEKIKSAKPRWFVGFSDNTNLTHTLTTLCDIATVYALCAPSFGMEPWDESVSDCYELLTGRKNKFFGYPKWEKESLKDEEHPLEPYNLTEEKKLVVYKGGRLFDLSKEDITLGFSGRLLGGCMDCLSTLIGTRFDGTANFIKKYKNDGTVWYLEACELNPMDIRRVLWKMRQAGWFDNAAGFVFGRPYEAWEQELFGVNRYNAVTDILGDLNVPIVLDADLGHFHPAIPIINGACGKITIENKNIGVEYEIC